jgi:SAM-dependent methyltransferase
MTAAPQDHDPYQQIPVLYDLEHDQYQEDVEFYLSFVQSTGDPVLELGCGTGRLLLPIARAGYRVTGLDQSPAMLERARARFAHDGSHDRVSLYEGPMTGAAQAPGGPFGVAIVALNGLLHLADAAEQRETLGAIRNALDPRGQLILDLVNPTPDTLRGFDHSLSHEGSWSLDDGTRVDKFAARRLFPATQIIQTDLWYDLLDSNGTLKRIASSYLMRYVYRAELELMLEVAGFKEWECYGSYELDPYDDHADRLIVTAEVSPSR